MRVVASGAGPVAGLRRPERTGTGGGAGVFTVPGSPGLAAAGSTGGAAPTMALASLEALMALQGLPPDPPERRRRAVRRGARLLDRLDELRLALLDGALPLDLLASLRAELAAATGEAGEEDAALAELLQEIELRSEVELAKLEQGGA